MAKHIHIWVEAGRQLGKTKDAGPAHAPAGSSKGGQFVSGSGGGGSGKKTPAASPVPHKLGAAMLKQENATKPEAPAAKEPRGNSSDPKEREAYKKMQREKQAANLKTKSPEEQAWHAKLAAKKKPEAMKTDPISHRTFSDPSPKASNTAPVTAERAEANAAHHAGLYHSTKDPEAKAHHKAEYQRWKKEAAKTAPM